MKIKEQKHKMSGNIPNTFSESTDDDLQTIVQQQLIKRALESKDEQVLIDLELLHFQINARKYQEQWKKMFLGRWQRIEHKRLWLDFNPIELKIGFAIYGYPTDEKDLYKSEEKKVIKNVLKQIMNEINKLKCDDILFSTVILPYFIKSNKKWYQKQRPPSTESLDVLFLIRTQNSSLIKIIDTNGRVYSSVQSFKENNKLPECKYAMPTDCKYQNGRDGKLLIEFLESPKSKIGNQILAVTDVATTVTGILTGVVSVGAIFIPVATPIVIGSIIVGAACGTYGIGRNATALFDRYQHKQSISFMDSDARSVWIDLGLNVFTVAMSAGSLYSSVTRSVGTAAQAGEQVTDAVSKGTRVAANSGKNVATIADDVAVVASRTGKAAKSGAKAGKAIADGSKAANAGKNIKNAAKAGKDLANAGKTVTGVGKNFAKGAKAGKNLKDAAKAGKDLANAANNVVGAGSTAAKGAKAGKNLKDVAKAGKDLANAANNVVGAGSTATKGAKAGKNLKDAAKAGKDLANAAKNVVGAGSTAAKGAKAGKNLKDVAKAGKDLANAANNVVGAGSTAAKGASSSKNIGNVAKAGKNLVNGTNVRKAVSGGIKAGKSLGKGINDTSKVSKLAMNAVQGIVLADTASPASIFFSSLKKLSGTAMFFNAAQQVVLSPMFMKTFEFIWNFIFSTECKVSETIKKLIQETLVLFQKHLAGDVSKQDYIGYLSYLQFTFNVFVTDHKAIMEGMVLKLYQHLNGVRDKSMSNDTYRMIDQHKRENIVSEPIYNVERMDEFFDMIIEEIENAELSQEQVDFIRINFPLYGNNIEAKNENKTETASETGLNNVQINNETEDSESVTDYLSAHSELESDEDISVSDDSEWEDTEVTETFE